MGDEQDSSSPKVYVFCSKLYSTFTDYTHPRKRAFVLVFAILYLLPPPHQSRLSSGYNHHAPNPENEPSCSFSGFLLQPPLLNPNRRPLATFPNPENEPSRSFSGFRLSLGCNRVPNPRTARMLVLGVPTFLWPPLST